MQAARRWRGVLFEPSESRTVREIQQSAVLGATLEVIRTRYPCGGGVGLPLTVAERQRV
jgi:hypothetical protein